MMFFIVGLLTVVLVLNCLLLGLLVLIQLPKKDAGVGMAFGGGATDALFGAGSGNVLTRITKWSAGIFFGLSFLLSILNNHMHPNSGAALRERLSSPAPGAAAPVSPAPITTPSQPAATPTPAPAPAPATGTGSASAPQIPLMIGTNAPAATAAPTSNAPAAK